MYIDFELIKLKLLYTIKLRFMKDNINLPNSKKSPIIKQKSAKISP